MVESLTFGGRILVDFWRFLALLGVTVGESIALEA
jgi:hypothetical protein